MGFGAGSSPGEVRANAALMAKAAALGKALAGLKPHSAEPG
jgi:hypothetical protein